VLRLNYVATEQLLQLATGHLPRLAAFIHISSVWAYADESSGSTVREVVKGLTMPSDQAVQPGDLVKELMDMEAWEADAEAHNLVKHWGFPDMYCLSKRLAELLVERYSQRYDRQYSFALVRPSIIGAVAAQPYPGYCLGNQNGATGVRPGAASMMPCQCMCCQRVRDGASRRCLPGLSQSGLSLMTISPEGTLTLVPLARCLADSELCSCAQLLTHSSLPTCKC
jgi:hypothetical protein